MLEYNFNNYDNDFITIWCRYLVTKDENFVLPSIEELAEKGQINALQAWYNFKQPGDNCKIDSILNSYNGGNFNELIAMANYHYYDENIHEIINEFNEAHKKAMYYSNLQIESEYKKYDELEVAAIRKFNRNQYFQHLSDAKERLADISFSTNYEIQVLHLAIVKRMKNLMEDFYNDSAQKLYKTNKRFFKKHEKLVVKRLLQKYKQEKENNPNLKPSDNPCFFFALGKALAFHSKKEQDRILGMSFLKALSERELLTFSQKTKMKNSGLTQREFEPEKTMDRLFENAYNATRNQGGLGDILER